MLLDRIQRLLVHLDHLVGTASLFNRDMPDIWTLGPDEARILRIDGVSLLNQLHGLCPYLLDLRILQSRGLGTQHTGAEHTQRRKRSHLGVDKVWALALRLGEFLNRLTEVDLHVTDVTRFVETIDRSSPQRKAPPILHLRRKVFLIAKLCQLPVQPFQRGAIALVVGALYLCH